MAIIHRATISPTKAELLHGVLGGPVTVLGSYRFDDPDGEVGVEAFVVRRGAAVEHVVMTYRGDPLEGAAGHLISTMEHSALGRRWVYDGSHDPVARACFERALRGDQEQAVEEVWDGDGRIGAREPTARLTVVGDPGPGADASLVIARVIDPSPDLGRGPRLRVEWDGGSAVVASLV